MALPKSESILADQPATVDETELIARYVKPHPLRGARAEAWFPQFGYRVVTLICYMKSELDRGVLNRSRRIYRSIRRPARPRSSIS